MGLHHKIEPSPTYLRIFFFITGIVATIAYRIIFLLDSFWIPVAWYTGTIGFVIYFWHRSVVGYKRAKLVKDYQLLEVIDKSQADEEKKSALRYLIETSLTSKEKFNSLFIFFASAFAFLFSLALDLYRLLF